MGFHLVAAGAREQEKNDGDMEEKRISHLVATSPGCMGFKPRKIACPKGNRMVNHKSS
jgi:hypothetical protein